MRQLILISKFWLHIKYYIIFFKKKIGRLNPYKYKKIIIKYWYNNKKNSNFCKEERLPRDLDASSQDMHLPPSLNFNKYGKVPDLSPWFLPRKKKASIVKVAEASIVKKNLRRPSSEWNCQCSGSCYCSTVQCHL